MRFDQCTNGNIFMHGWTKEQAVMSDHDKAILQELAKKMAAYAARPEEEARIQLWRDHNDLKDKRLERTSADGIYLPVRRRNGTGMGDVAAQGIDLRRENQVRQADRSQVLHSVSGTQHHVGR